MKSGKTSRPGILIFNAVRDLFEIAKESPSQKNSSLLDLCEITTFVVCRLKEKARLLETTAIFHQPNSPEPFSEDVASGGTFERHASDLSRPTPFGLEDLEEAVPNIIQRDRCRSIEAAIDDV